LWLLLFVVFSKAIAFAVALFVLERMIHIKKPAASLHNRFEPPFEFKFFYESILLDGGGLESNDTRSITIEMKKMV
jgi:hypothetical protein